MCPLGALVCTYEYVFRTHSVGRCAMCMCFVYMCVYYAGLMCICEFLHAPCVCSTLAATDDLWTMTGVAGNLHVCTCTHTCTSWFLVQKVMKASELSLLGSR